MLKPKSSVDILKTPCLTLHQQNNHIQTNRKKQPKAPKKQSLFFCFRNYKSPNFRAPANNNQSHLQKNELSLLKILVLRYVCFALRSRCATIGLGTVAKDMGHFQTPMQILKQNRAKILGVFVENYELLCLIVLYYDGT
jgi:hypothetical protein